MSRSRISVAFTAGFICIFVAWGFPARPQGAKIELEETIIASTSIVEEDSDLAGTVTTADSTIPVDELKLLVKPLTLEELEQEAKGWLFLLKDKVQAISDTEITIKRENRILEAEKSAITAVESAKTKLEIAQEALKNAAPDSPESESASKKVEAAREDLKKALEAIESVIEIQEEEAKDEALQAVLEKAEADKEVKEAKEILKQTQQERENLTAGSPEYQETTEKIEALEQGIADLEKAEEEQQGAAPDSPEYAEATKKVEQARIAIKQATEAIQGKATEDKSSSSGENLEEAASALEDTQLQETERKLQRITQQLKKNAEAESELKAQLLMSVTNLQSERIEIVDRFKVVLNELENKGGDGASYRKYIQAISTVELDLKDTEGLGVRLGSWLLSEEGGRRWVINVGKFVAILVITSILVQFLASFLNKFLSSYKNVSALLRQFVIIFVKRGGMVLGFVIALTALEISIGPVVALLGGASFVAAFALQSNLGNFASGLMLMLNKPFDVGDEVKIAGVWGWVDSISLANTKIKGWDKEIISIPNNTVWGGKIENLTTSDTRRGGFTVRLKHGADIRKVKKILIDLAKSHPKVIENPPPGTFAWGYSDYCVPLGLKFSTKTEDFWSAFEDLTVMVQEKIERGELEYALPQQDLRIQNVSGKEVMERWGDGEIG
ncbi:MAG: mechanosensitive ion channel [Prochloron sp. SP5CPC1]|nr:mechanosensitive ion channel [Candidatus Paraprochloron terpiosi SP5CPC1]